MIEILESTIIDDLVKNRLISLATRSKCVLKGIFTVGDIKHHVNRKGEVFVAGLSRYGNEELQAIWDSFKQTSASSVTSANKSRKPTRTLSENEKKQINELTSFFQDSFLSSSNSDDDAEGIISLDNLIPTPKEVPKASSSTRSSTLTGNTQPHKNTSNTIVDMNDFETNIDLFLDFVLLNKRYPERTGTKHEAILRKWFYGVRTGKIHVSESQRDVFDYMRDNIRNIVK